MHIIQSPYFLSDIQNKVPSLAAKDWEILRLIFYSPAPFFFISKFFHHPLFLQMKALSKSSNKIDL